MISNFSLDTNSFLRLMNALNISITYLKNKISDYKAFIVDNPEDLEFWINQIDIFTKKLKEFEDLKKDFNIQRFNNSRRK